ncbi:MAG: murein biosynthesis integral membrane protein MurJ [Candidatus Bipolaricaulota bacterium]
MRPLTGDVFRAALGTGFSRLFGLGRDIAIAHVFGATGVYDAFLAAFFVPNLLRGLLGEGGLAAAFLPVYGRAQAQGRARPVAAHTMSALLVLLPVVCALGAWTARWYIPLIAAGFPEEQLQLAISLGQWIFPVLGLVSLAALAAGILNANGRFFVPALAPALPNLAMIGAALLLAPLVRPPIAALVFGLLAGAAGMLLIQVPFLRGHVGPLPKPWPPRSELKEMGKRLLPVLGGVAMAEVNILVDTRLASYLAEGAISTLQYAMRLFQFPIGIVAVSVAAAALPRFARTSAGGLQGPFRDALRQGLGLGTLLILPAMAGLLALGSPIITLLFEHGAFTAQDTARTYAALSAYLSGLWAYSLVYLFSRAFYGLGSPAVPVLTGTLAVAVNIGLDLLWVGPWGTFGLALATGLAGWVNALALGYLLWRRGRGWIPLRPVLGAAAAATLTGLSVAGADRWVLSPYGAWVQVFAGVALGAAVYALATRAIGLHSWLKAAR